MEKADVLEMTVHYLRELKRREHQGIIKKQCYQFDDIYYFTNPQASQMFQKFISARRLIFGHKRTTPRFFFFFFLIHHSEALSFQTVLSFYRGVHRTESVQQSISTGPLHGGSNITRLILSIKSVMSMTD